MKRGRGGGVGSWGGVGSRCTVSNLPDLRGAGGGGGTPRREPGDEEMLSDAGRAAGGGGGGGGALPCPLLPVLTMLPVLPFTGGIGGGGSTGTAVAVFFSFSCFKNSTIKSWFSLMKSSASPCSDKKFPKFSRQLGSYVSSLANSEVGFR